MNNSASSCESSVVLSNRPIMDSDIECKSSGSGLLVEAFEDLPVDNIASNYLKTSSDENEYSSDLNQNVLLNNIALESECNISVPTCLFENNIATTECGSEDIVISSTKNMPIGNTPGIKSIKDKQLQLCSFCGKQFKCVKKHIQASHPEEYRSSISRKYDHTKSTEYIPVSDNIVEQDIVISCTNNQNAYHKQLDEWISLFKQEMDKEFFCKKVEELSFFLSEAVEFLPGPKNPASKYYKARKSGNFITNDRKYSDSKNPERKSKRDRQKRKEKYLYQKAQFLYFNQRRKACRMVLNGKTIPCRIPTTILHEAFSQRYSIPNLNKRDEYKSKLDPVERQVMNETYSLDISPADIMNSMKHIAIDTASGPDRILMRVVKSERVSVIISLIASTMLKYNWVPDCFKQARTVLIYKSGDENDSNNWRPISICSILQRIIERVLDKDLRKFESFNTNQRGFTPTPGTHINVSIISAVLTKAKLHKEDASIVFLDISKAFDGIGHDHLEATLKSSNLPNKLQDLILNLQTGNITQIEINNGKTKPITINRGVLQGAPLSPSLYNLGTDHILEELSEVNVSEAYGFDLVEGLNKISILAFADDTVLIGKSKTAAIELTRMVKQRLCEIGLSLNASKSSAIIIEKGILVEGALKIDDNMTINSLKQKDTIKYLGVNFSDSLDFNSMAVVKHLKDSLETLTASPLLKADQKLNILNQYIWPTLIYPLQNAPLTKLPKAFLDDVDKMIKSAVKEILSLPADTPDSMIYSPRKYKGLGIFRARWEAFIQHINICRVIEKANNAHVNMTRGISEERQHCFKNLGVNELDLLAQHKNQPVKAEHIRDYLRKREYDAWCKLVQRGKGVILYQEYTPANQWITNKIGISCSEWRDALKLTGNVAPVRALHGRSQDGNRCRHCNEIETLPHVLGFCHYGELLRNSRHHSIRSLIANAFREKNFDVYEEVHGLSSNGSTRRIDIIVIDRTNKQGYILDPTVRFETHSAQAQEVDREKKDIYNPTIPYYQELYNLNSIEVIGLLVGARGTITEFLNSFRSHFGLKKELLQEIALSALKGSIAIFRNHVYGQHKS